MITLTIHAENGEPFTVRFQNKSGQSDDGSPIWQDSEVVQEVGQSQSYGLDGNFRLIVETPVQIEQNDG